MWYALSFFAGAFVMLVVWLLVYRNNKAKVQKAQDIAASTVDKIKDRL